MNECRQLAESGARTTQRIPFYACFERRQERRIRPGIGQVPDI